MFPIFISLKAGCDSVSPSFAWQLTQNKALVLPKSTKQAGNQVAGGGGEGEQTALREEDFIKIQRKKSS